jgi:uncharacterized protein (TIGR02246 family)
MSEQSAIRKLITDWAHAVHVGDMDTLLKDHDSDIVMFDVPPPHRGVRGIDDYRDVWPPFFEWQRQGSQFEILELDVTASDTVAFAWALLRVGTAEDYEKEPDRWMRLTIGLRKRDGHWVVTHEHHSFCDTG